MTARDHHVIIIELFFGYGDGDVPIADAAVMVALEEEGSGLGFIAVERSACDAGDSGCRDRPCHRERR